VFELTECHNPELTGSLEGLVGGATARGSANAVTVAEALDVVTGGTGDSPVREQVRRREDKRCRAMSTGNRRSGPSRLALPDGPDCRP